MAFTGLIKISDAITGYSSIHQTSPSTQCCTKLIGPSGKGWMTVGGGNNLGKFTTAAINTIISEMSMVKGAGYSGLVFDIEKISGTASTNIPLL